MLPSQRRKTHEDILIKRIEDCETTHDVLGLYIKHCDIMTHRHLLRSLRVLNLLASRGDVDFEELHHNEDFQEICQRILKLSRRMEADELLLLLQYLCRLKVNVRSKLVGTVLQLLKHSINDLELKGLIHLEFLLRKLPSTSVSQALQIAIPLLIENALLKEPIENLSLKQLSEVLVIGARGRIRNLNVILREIYDRGCIYTGKIAHSFLWTLLDMYARENVVRLKKEDTLISEILLKECLKVFSKNIDTFTIGQIETTLGKISQACDRSGSACYSEQFFDATVVHCIQKDVGFVRASHILRKLLRVNFLSEDLTNYIVELLLQEREKVLSAPVIVPPLITAIAACPSSNASHIEVVELLLNHRSLTLDLEYCLRSPILSLVLDLLSLGYYHHPLIEIVTSAEFLSQYVVNFPKSHLTSRQLLQLNQVLSLDGEVSLRVPDEFLKDANNTLEDNSEESDLKSRLHLILKDPECVASGVLTDDDLYIDHLIAMDEEGKPMKICQNMSTEGFTRLSDLDIPESYKRIAILDVKPYETYSPKNVLKRYVQVHQKLLTASGFVAVPVIQSLVHRLTGDERNLYIENLIKC
ncbi:uncharacterized protein LOC135207207 [Macrobrachium nipponense]|uniref:uncharacterized protein LOC135207207 n=1 Tax=Macrobrachium nipponense TaxID=159736 RepID=UPI0030C7A1ED